MNASCMPSSLVYMPLVLLCRSYRSLQDLDRTPKHELYEWWSLGIALGLECYELEEIKANYPTSVKSCMAQVISKWLSMISGQFSWRTLSLKSDLVNQPVLAHAIERKYCSVELLGSSHDKLDD